MTRRSVLKAAAASMTAAGMNSAPTQPKGRLKQSAARWCYKNMSIDELCRQGAEMGLSGIDLVDPKEWPTLQKYGLVSSMIYSAGTIPDGWNRKENHDRLVKEMQAGIERAAAAKAPNVITFSGNRRGQPDEEGKENCIIGLNRVKKMA
ncbi:MAG: hydroxypyruvate isomerase, partial [Acidobacteriaceae bacterium]|nr:hydroxypyruvate isomerase [Acidobacteriaceae bacterium]